MVQVINRKTQLPYSFTDEDWQLLKDKGLQGKYKVLSKTEVKSSAKPTYTPPELDVNLGNTEEKPEVKKPVQKRKTAE